MSQTHDGYRCYVLKQTVVEITSYPRHHYWENITWNIKCYIFRKFYFEIFGCYKMERFMLKRILILTLREDNMQNYINIFYDSLSLHNKTINQHRHIFVTIKQLATSMKYCDIEFQTDGIFQSFFLSSICAMNVKQVKC